MLGSDCFKTLHGGGATQNPSYGSASGRRLTDEERQLLLQNTERLIEQFRLATEAAQAEARLKLKKLQELHAKLQQAAQKPPNPGIQSLRQAFNPRIASAAPLEARPPRKIGPTADEIKRFEFQAKNDVRAQYQVDADLPGWRGLVLARITQLSRAAQGA
jgi:hypothetical protein